MAFNETSEQQLADIMRQATEGDTTAMIIGIAVQHIHSAAAKADALASDGVKPGGEITVLQAAFNMLYHKMAHDMLQLFFTIQEVRASFIGGTGGQISSDMDKHEWNHEEIVEMAHAMWRAVGRAILDD